MKLYDEKEKRKMRRLNHIARDLRTPKYRMRRVESPKDKGEKYKNQHYDEMNDYDD